MSKTVLFLFHDDEASLGLGSRLAGGIAAAHDPDVQLEVFCFGPAQSALIPAAGEPEHRAAYRDRIDALAADGVRVVACRAAADAAGAADDLTERGVVLDSPRELVLQYTREGAVVLSF